MKHVKCRVCGERAIPLYARLWEMSDKDGKEHLRFVRIGEKCQTCNIVGLLEEIYVAKKK